MKTQELIKLLKKNKCYIIRNGGKHNIWYSRLTQKQFPVPRHKAEIPPGTLNNILKDAGLKPKLPKKSND
ncbi:type II toxin-antitoxin system HicA family toxin [bacterium 1XD21-13]|nr:type II toxin-antitoxin system HicA family toxin [bacterium 1XD21-13]